VKDLPGPDPLDDSRITLSPDGEHMAVCLSDYDKPTRPGLIRIFDHRTGKITYQSPEYDPPFDGVYYSGDGSILLGRRSNDHVVAWDAATHEELWRREESTQAVMQVAAHPERPEFFVSRFAKTPENPRTGSLEVWDAKTGKLLRALPFEGFAHTLRFSFDNHVLVVGTRNKEANASNMTFDCSIRLLDPLDGHELASWNGGFYGIRNALLTPNGKRIIAMFEDGNFLVIDRETGEEIVNLREPRYPFHQFTMTPRGLVIATTLHYAGLFALDGRLEPAAAP
jgi:WD40 repeat protein